jgi:polyisoprenoid-binding protein YceI
MRHSLTTLASHGLAALLLITTVFTPAAAADYEMDIEGKHAFIRFKVSHLGYSYVLGEFPDFTGKFSYDADDPSVASVTVDIDTTSVETHHAKRNVHIRGKDFLHVKKFPTAKFASTGYEDTGGGEGILTGDLTLRGVTRPVTIEMRRIGEGKDPWGSYRAGFEGTTVITMADFGMDYNLGPASRTAEIYFSIEGIRE